MGVLRIARPARSRPAPLRAEELEPRTLLAAAAVVGVAHPLHQVVQVAAEGLSQALAAHGPGHAGRAGLTPAYQPDQSPAGYWPSQLRHAYGFDKLSLDGTGQTVAIVDAFHDPNIANDLAAFDAQFNLPPPPSFVQIDQNGNDASDVPSDFTGDWEIEEALDVEWVHGIAPRASIVLVEAFSNSYDDLLTAVDTARNLSGVVAVSMSWGGPEDASQTGGDAVFTTPSGHPGVTFVTSSGDSGAPGGYPAMSPNVLAVGGTTLQLDGPNNRVSEVGWGGSGGGPSSVEGQPAYQSTYAQSTYVRNTLGNTALLNGPRGNPDVSYVADPFPGVAMYNTFPNEFGALGWFAVGGTSDAAPQWAALVALVDQGRGAGKSLDGATQFLPALYQIGANPTAYPNDFFDVTSGFNGYRAAAGYDFVTGLGSPRADHLIPDLIGNTGNSGPVSFSVTTSTGSPVAGAAFSVTVTALDSSGHTFTGYAGTVHFTTSDKGAGVVLPADYTFTAGDQGSHTFTGGVTLVTAGGQTVSTTDTANSGLAGQANVTVNAAATSAVTVSAPSSAGTGTPFTVTVTAKDRFGNAAGGYRGTVHFTTSDTDLGVVLPGDYTFTAGDNGAHTFSGGVTLVTVGTQTVTATDTANAALTGQAGVNVTQAQATHFSVSAPAGSAAGSAFSVTVTALDANNQVVTGYTGRAHFTTSDGGAGVALPGDYTFTAADNGTHTFSGVTLVTAGSQTVTATDTGASGISGTAAVTVSPAAAQAFSVTGFPSPIPAGTSGTFTVTARDAYGNVATGYRGTVTFSSSDPQAILPGNATLLQGTGTFSATLNTVGRQSITATDTVAPSITGSQTGVQVTSFSGPGPVITDVEPHGGSTGGGNFVIVYGSNLNNAIAVYFGTTPAVIVGDGPITVDVIAPAHAAGTVDIKVVTAGGATPTSSVDQYTYFGSSTPALAPPVSVPPDGPPGGGTGPNDGGTSDTGPALPPAPGVGVPPIVPPTTPGGPNQAALDALLAQWALDGVSLPHYGVYTLGAPSGSNAAPPSQNGPSDGTVSSLPADGDTGATGADGMSLPTSPSARWRRRG
jgi:hypothetical protein